MILIIVISIVGYKGSKWTLGRKHVYKTYYGYIDVDTIEKTLEDLDGSMCYVVHTEGQDTIYYNPTSDTYKIKFPSHDEYGNVVVDFEPGNDE